jgi:hypothetical protein
MENENQQTDLSLGDIALTIGQLNLQILDLQAKNAKLQAQLDALNVKEPVNSKETTK